MSISTSLSTVSSAVTTKFVHDFASSLSPPPHDQLQINNIKKKRSLPGNPDPDAEVIALSPKTLLATNRFVCEVCNKGFKREQNLQLHRRGHNLPWKLKQRSSSKEMMKKKKKAYVCPEASCVHHHPCRALGDLTGIKKHFCRKHGEKKWMCNKCSKLYAVQSDWKAHSKTCGTREYICQDCGTLFSRKSSFITHRAFCEALAEESARLLLSPQSNNLHHFPPQNIHQQPSNPIFTTQHEHLSNLTNSWDPPPPNPNPNFNKGLMITSNNATSSTSNGATSATTTTNNNNNNNVGVGFGFGEVVGRFSPEFLGLTRDFLGLAGGSVNFSVNVRDVLNFAGGVEFQAYERVNLKPHAHGHGFGFAASETWGDY